MNKLQLINDDYKGYVEHVHHACRGILLNGSNIFLCYESKENKYIIPGGGLEEGETLEGACEREILEETGYEEFHATNIADYGLYRREYTALEKVREVLKI